jgi:hypothetical protein
LLIVQSVWRRARTIGKWAGILIIFLLLAALTYEHAGAWRDGRILKQVGRSVDIGGRRLNIHCTGEGSPTVPIPPRSKRTCGAVGLTCNGVLQSGHDAGDRCSSPTAGMGFRSRRRRR